MSDGVKKALSIIGLILAILSIVFCWTMVAGVVLGVIAIIFAVLTIKSRKGMAIATIVLGIIGIILSILVGVVFATALSFLGGLF